MARGGPAAWPHNASKRRMMAWMVITMLVISISSVVSTEMEGDHANLQRLLATTGNPTVDGSASNEDGAMRSTSTTSPPLYVLQKANNTPENVDVFEVAATNSAVPSIKLQADSSNSSWTIEWDASANNPSIVASKVLLNFGVQAAVRNVSIKATLKDSKPSLVLDAHSLTGLANLKTFALSGLTVSFLHGRWLPIDTNLDKLVFSDCNISNFLTRNEATIQKVKIQNSTLDKFPIEVLRKDPSRLYIKSATFSKAITLNASDLVLFHQIGEFSNVTAPSSESCESNFKTSSVQICVQGLSDASTDPDHPVTTAPITRLANRSDDSGMTVIAAAVGLLIVAAIFGFLLYSGRQTPTPITTTKDSHLPPTIPDLPATNPKISLMDTATTEVALVSEYTGTLCEYDLGKENVTMEKKLGINGLWIAEYLGKTVVAMRLNPSMLVRIEGGLEGVVMTIPRLRHPNITKFIGISPIGMGDHLIVTEYMPKRNLHTLIMTQGKDLSWSQRILMSRDIVTAVGFLHTLPTNMVTKCTSSKNVLCGQDLSCKLNIHAIATVLRRRRLPNVRYGFGEIVYCAPELLRGEQETDATEIFTLGIIFCELALGTRLYSQLFEECGFTQGEIQIATEVAANRLWPPALGPSAPPEFSSMVQACTAFDPRNRPSISKVAMCLHALDA